LDALRDALNHSVQPACFFELGALSLLQAHPENPAEVARLGETAVQFFDVMLSVLARHLETVLQPVLELTQGLEDRTRLEEAARRMDKSQQSKGRGGKGGAAQQEAAGENLPGLELW
jgi:hypothetical protein